jgi:staphyloferrin A synthase
VLSTVVGEQIAALRRRYRFSADVLWAQVAATIRGAYADLPTEARRDGEALLRDPLPVKAMTVMRLADRPIDDVWARLANPMAGLR